MKNKILFIAVGVILIGLGIFLYNSGKELMKRCTEETTATVVEIIEKIDSDSDGISYLYYPKFEYKVDRKVINKVSDEGSNPSRYSVNQKVEILYNPNKPEEMIIKGSKSSIIAPIIVSVIGLVAFAAGIVVKKD